MRKSSQVWIPILLVAFATVAASAQSFRVQCPTSTITHPDPTNAGVNNSEPPYNGPTQFTTNAQGYVSPTSGTVNGAIKCQQISGGDGLFDDGATARRYSCSPSARSLGSRISRPACRVRSSRVVFNTPYPGTLTRGDPATTDGATAGNAPWHGFARRRMRRFTWNGAVGLAPDIPNIVTVTDIIAGPLTSPLAAPHCAPGGAASASTVTVFTDSPLGVSVGSQIVIANDAHSTGIGGTPTPAGLLGTYTVTCVDNGGLAPDLVVNGSGFNGFAFQYSDTQPAQGCPTSAMTTPAPPRRLLRRTMDTWIPAPSSMWA